MSLLCIAEMVRSERHPIGFEIIDNVVEEHKIPIGFPPLNTFSIARVGGWCHLRLLSREVSITRSCKFLEHHQPAVNVRFAARPDRH